MTQNPSAEVQLVLDQLLATDENTTSLEEGMEMVGRLRRRSRENGKLLDRWILGEIQRLRSHLRRAQRTQQELRAVVEKLTATPWYPALLLRMVDTPLGPRALVLLGGSNRLVECAPEVDASSLQPGIQVYLNQDQSVLMAVAAGDLPWVGETAFFERRMSDGRLLLRSRDDELVVDAAGSLPVDSLRPGDRVRWEREAWMAFERIGSTQGQQFLLEAIGDFGREQVGGQDAALGKLLDALVTKLVHPETASAYGVTGRRSIVLYGPPGNGKTLLSRVAASEIQRLSGRRCHFSVVKPGEFESPWVGETQQNIRNCFKALREASGEDLGILFLDEIEAVGRIRGSSVSQHSDRFLAALLAEMDGFADRGSIAVIAATNRKDLIDPALLDRISDMQIAIRRPTLDGARQIFQVHLGETLPYRQNGMDAESVRSELIERAVSTLYAPNAGSELCMLHFRDASTRTVSCGDLLSGRMIEQICRSARESAFLRHLEGGEQGIALDDLSDAIAEVQERLVSTLTPRNARAYLDDLPQDLDVVRVEPLRRRVRQPLRYVNPE